ncbi:hypothetical protein C8Q75DRAFT_728017, partial [Abortiporus biennis]
SSIYTFYKPNPEIEYVGYRHSHIFTCGAKGCSKKICYFLDTRDTKSTSNLCKHTKAYWREEVVETADEVCN